MVIRGRRRAGVRCAVIAPRMAGPSEASHASRVVRRTATPASAAA